jgi:hypothetical protein
MGSTYLVFYLLLVYEEGLERLVEVFFNEILHELVIQSDDTDEQGNRKGIKLGGLHFQNDLGQYLSGNVSAGLSVRYGHFAPLLDQGADFAEGQMAAVGCVVISPIRIFFDLKMLGGGVGSFSHSSLLK